MLAASLLGDKINEYFDAVGDLLAALIENKDPEWGEPKDWLPWTDADRWELGSPGGEDVPPPPEFEDAVPTPRERFVLSPLGGSQSDWEEYDEWSSHLDQSDAAERLLETQEEAQRWS